MVPSLMIKGRDQYITGLHLKYVLYVPKLKCNQGGEQLVQVPQKPPPLVYSLRTYDPKQGQSLPSKEGSVPDEDGRLEPKGAKMITVPIEEEQRTMIAGT